MKKLTLQLLLAIGVMAFFASCDDEAPQPSGNVTITGIPSASTLAVGEDLSVSGVQLTADAGIASFSFAIDGGAATNFSGIAVGETSATVDITISTDNIAVGVRTLTFTLTDQLGATETAQHVLTLNQFSTVSVDANIDADITWTKNNVYVLSTRVTVLDGVTLTIEAGTIIKGESGAGENATALLIARGGKIMAEGSVTEPIIFTAVNDEIEPGMIASPNMPTSLDGLWGGVLILGRAPISADAEAVQIEGIPPSDQNGLYGGTDPTDNSGIFRYVSIRHGGANIGEGNEINGLTLGGVGSGTTIEFVEIVANQDDGIEWFGGTVNVSNALVWNTGDDAIDTDQAWSGTLDNFIVLNPGDEAFELDGPEGSGTGVHTIQNGSVLADGASGLIDFDGNSEVEMDNVYFFELSTGQDVEEFDACAACIISDFQATVPAATTKATFFTTGADAFVTEVSDGSNTVGAAVSMFSFTWANANGALTGF